MIQRYAFYGTKVCFLWYKGMLYICIKVCSLWYKGVLCMVQRYALYIKDVCFV